MPKDLIHIYCEDCGEDLGPDYNHNPCRYCETCYPIEQRFADEEESEGQRELQEWGLYSNDNSSW